MTSQVLQWLKRHAIVLFWALASFALIGPPLMAWIVRAAAFADACRPGPEACNLPFGAALRVFLNLSWAFSAHLGLLVSVSLIATLAAFCKRKPLFGTLSFFLLPMIALALPMLAVFVSRYDGCEINPDGVGDCVLWGTRMGMSFHTAATVQDKLYDLMPALAGLTVMLGLLGWFFAHPSRRRVKQSEQDALQMRQFVDPAPPERP